MRAVAAHARLSENSVSTNVTNLWQTSPMASTAIALRLSLTRLRPIPNPSLLRHFSSDSTNVHDQNKPRSENSTV
ncbi:hypothetical protein RHGRI_011743 [Rhododendron griersonianum]|uniref:Uncharacterized protein n=1 Tax=Rhododendron griersonianum TaxID=479676 RepID=A0AAV6KPC0_9ERIC|nr:hypothetical protein RHGRI_011743 [Rhododendron griersonianum]